MTFDKINRRTHLYLGLLLTPFFLLYAVSGFILNHGEWFQGSGQQTPRWTTVFERAYRLPPISDDDDEDVLAERVLRDQGLPGRYRADFDDDGNLVIDRIKLTGRLRLTYYPKQGRLIGQQERVALPQLITAAHFRSGYEYPYFLEYLWAAMIDLLVLSSLIWIASGIYLWWKLTRFRFWGWVSLAAGMASFVLLIRGL
ncbi:MAG TPA: hypothetical protein VHB50_15400 [Bryobacteraceae bacterium]|nr:hypothetical protein [Bryobacteraceae bacterium]